MFANSKKVTTFAPAIEREILDKKDGPFVYRLGRKIFILERGVRFPHGLPNKKAIDKSRDEELEGKELQAKVTARYQIDSHVESADVWHYYS